MIKLLSRKCTCNVNAVSSNYASERVTSHMERVVDLLSFAGRGTLKAYTPGVPNVKYLWLS